MPHPNPPIDPRETMLARKFMQAAGVLLALAVVLYAGRVIYDGSPWIQGLLPSPEGKFKGGECWQGADYLRCAGKAEGWDS